MFSRNFFVREQEFINKGTMEFKTRHSKNDIECDTAELKELITNWTQNEGWEYENFADFIELIGVTTPVKLSEFDEKSNSFKCSNVLGKEISISLLFGDWMDFCSQILITHGGESRRYNINTNSKKGKSVPTVTLEVRNIKKDGKELESYYCEFFCHRMLKLDDIHLLKVELDDFCNYNNQSDIIVLRNCDDIEDYLLSLDNHLVVSEVYEKIVNFLNVDISKCGKILISYIENDQTRGNIRIVDGKMQEYAILENGETFHVFEDGSWKYLSDNGIRIIYHGEMKQYVFSITGSEENITKAVPSEVMKRAKAGVSELWKFVR